MSEQEKKSSADKKEESKPAKVKKPGLFQRIGKWFRELKSEAKKVVWPTRSQTVNNTLVVICMVILVGVFVAALDYGFGAIVKLVTSILA